MTAQESGETDESTLWEELHKIVEDEDRVALQQFMELMSPAQTLRSLFRLDLKDQYRLLALLSAEDAAEIVADLPDNYAAGLIEHLETDHAAHIVDELPSDHGADLLASLEGDSAEAILGGMLPSTAGRVRELISYNPDVAGGLMLPEDFAYSSRNTVAEVIDNLRQRRETLDVLPQRILLLDSAGRPEGAVDVVDLLLGNSNDLLAQHSKPIETVNVNASLDALDEYFESSGTLGVPVVDDDGKLIGRLRRRSVMDAISEHAQDDQMKVQGIVGGDELRSMSIVSRSRKRLSWLSINIVLNIIAASVIAFYQDTLSAVIALAMFLPIVSDMSGCSGNQAVAVSMRELTLGIINPRDVLRVWWQEASVGILNGIVLGALIAAAALLWQGSPMLGVVVGAALALNTVIAVSIGGTVPLILKARGIDPAVASGPLLTTVTDMCGFFLVLGLATIMLPWLL